MIQQDSLKINQNDDGTFSIDWDPKDPNWSFLNGLTSEEIQSMIEELVTNELNK
jgi:hypothetical protein